MLKHLKKLTLDVFDFSGNKMCQIYDNNTDVEGQATDVIIVSERNGSKTLRFNIQSSETDPNYRIEYIKADYKIRAIDDNGIDWFVMTEPKITHSNKSTNMTITATHTSQILKYRKLDLEFSDKEGNNGPATPDQFLITILEGTEWKPGNVDIFYEKNGSDIKYRTFNSGLKTGAFKMISAMCDLFKAKPVYHAAKNGRGGTVDIVHLNPFTDSIDETTGTPDLTKCNNDILEIHYGVNGGAISRTLNSENIVDKLYCYGAYGDDVSGYCGIEELTHKEWHFTADGLEDGGLFYIKATDPFIGTEMYWGFEASGGIEDGNDLIFSALDEASELYIWDDTEEWAYRRISKSIYPPEDGSIILECTKEEDVQNWFSFLMDFTYYDSIGAITDDALEAIAEYQRYGVYSKKKIYDKTLEYNTAKSELTQNVGEVDYAKINCISQQSANGDLQLIISTNGGQYPDGVIYRSDYEKLPRNYFKWRISTGVKKNGLSINDEASVVYIILYTGTGDNPKQIKYIKSYIKEISEWDNDRQKITLWTPYVDRTPDAYLNITSFYIFSVNDANGDIGITEERNFTQPVIGTSQQLNVFWSTTLPTCTKDPITYDLDVKIDNVSRGAVKYGEFAFSVVYSMYMSEFLPSRLYFCYNFGNRPDVGFNPVIVSLSSANEIPVNYSYWYQTDKGKIFRGLDGEWNLFYDPDEPMSEDKIRRDKVREAFAAMYEAVKASDMARQGYYDEYTYYVGAEGLGKGHYAIDTGYDYRLFDLDVDMTQGDYFVYSTHTNYITPHVASVDKDIIPVTCRSWSSAIWYTPNLLSDVYWTHGNINDEGKQIDDSSNWITNYMPVYEKMAYVYHGATPCKIYWYKSTDEFIEFYEYVDGETKEAPPEACWARMVCTVDEREATFGYEDEDGSWVVFTVNKISNAYKRLDIKRGNPCKEILCNGKTFTLDETAPDTMLNFYDQNHEFIEAIPISGDDSVTAPSGAIYMIAYANNIGGYYIGEPYKRNDYLTKLNGNTIYYEIGTCKLKGLYSLYKQFVDLTNKVYAELIPAIESAQREFDQKEVSLIEELGDIYKEGYYQESGFTEDDTKKLYNEGRENLSELCKPTASYTTNWKDLSEEQEVDEDIFWGTVTTNYAAHLIDPSININVWAFIDKVSMCYDKPWETQISINTNLSTIAQHSFTDVLSHIADVAKSVKANENVYDRAAVITEQKTFDGNFLEGAISTDKAKIVGAGSNWYTDNKGNMIFESADGQSAMMLTGKGFSIADSRDEYGDWQWQSFGTGSGFSASLITSGTIRSDLIEAGSITANKLSAFVGQELDLSSNTSLKLYATRDGRIPAGSVDVVKNGGSLISIDADKGVDIASGTQVNIQANNTVDIVSSDVTLKGNRIDINATDSGDASTVNIAGSTVNIDILDGTGTKETALNIDYRKPSSMDVDQYIKLNKDGMFVKATDLYLETYKDESTKKEEDDIFSYIYFGDKDNTGKIPNYIRSDGTIVLNDGPDGAGIIISGPDSTIDVSNGSTLNIDANSILFKSTARATTAKNSLAYQLNGTMVTASLQELPLDNANEGDFWLQPAYKDDNSTRVDEHLSECQNINGVKQWVNIVEDSTLTMQQRAAIDAVRGQWIANHADDSVEHLNRYLEFSDEGLKQFIPGDNHNYYTLITDEGFYVMSKQTEQPVAEMDAIQGVKTRKLTMGNVVCKQTSKGGWVWQEV